MQSAKLIVLMLLLAVALGSMLSPPLPSIVRP